MTTQKFDLRTAQINPRLKHVLRLNGDRFLIHIDATPREREAMKFWAEDRFSGCANCTRPHKRLFAISPVADFDSEWEIADIVPMFAARQCSCPGGSTYLDKIRGATLSQLLKMGDGYWGDRSPEEWAKFDLGKKNFRDVAGVVETIEESFNIGPDDVPF